MKKNVWITMMLALAMMCCAGVLCSCGDDDEPSDTVVNYVVQELAGGEFTIQGATDAQIAATANPVTTLQQACSKWDGQNMRHDNKVIEACDDAYDAYVKQYTGCGYHITCKVAVIRKVTSTSDPMPDTQLTTYTFDIK